MNLQYQVCGIHKPLTAEAARRVAAKMRADGREHASCFRCPYCHWWHVSTHPPSMETLAQIALAIRKRSGNAPGPRRETA